MGHEGTILYVTRPVVNLAHQPDQTDQHPEYDSAALPVSNVVNLHTAR